MEAMTDAARRRATAVWTIVAMLVTAAGALAPAGAAGASAWAWPVLAPRVVSAYVAPAHAYAPGHRGVDVESRSGTTVYAPDDGVIAFAGTVVDRAIVTIDHGGGIVSTLEPVTPRVAAGEVVARGDVVGDLAIGGHAPAGTLHLGARIDGEYVNPLRFLGGIPRAVLLPCC